MISTDIKSSKEVVDKLIKGNIPVKKNLLNKYENIAEIFKQEQNKLNNNVVIRINKNISELENVDINILKINQLKKLAYKIFNNYHTSKIFYNNKNKIFVNKTGINESVEKIYYNRIQRNYLCYHLMIFSILGKVIENGMLINQVKENKGRLKYITWHYYIQAIIINNKRYIFEFDVVSMINGENHYRIQRLELLEHKKQTSTKGVP